MNSMSRQFTGHMNLRALFALAIAQGKQMAAGLPTVEQIYEDVTGKSSPRKAWSSWAGVVCGAKQASKNLAHFEGNPRYRAHILRMNRSSKINRLEAISIDGKTYSHTTPEWENLMRTGFVTREAASAPLVLGSRMREVPLQTNAEFFRDIEASGMDAREVPPKEDKFSAFNKL